MTDRPPPPAVRRTQGVLWLLVGLVAVAGVLPFRSILTHYPWKVDAVKWVSRGATNNASWVDWVFAQTHFVGYRPVAAISYSLGFAIDGYGPEVHRSMDLGFQALAVVAVAYLFRALVQRTDAWMVVAALLFAAHPVIEEIVPFLARRSYPMSTLLLAGGLGLWLDGLRHDRVLTPSAFVGSLAVVAALLTNETSYVVLPLLPAFALWRRREGLLKALERCIPVLTGALCAVVLRFLIIGWAGGYEKHYFAVAGAGRKSLKEVQYFNLHRIVGAAFEYTWLPVSMDGDANPLRAAWTLHDLLASLPTTDITLGVQLVLFGVVAYYTWSLVFTAASREDRGAHLILLAWMMGCSILYGLSRTWFWRQGYPMTVPLVLVLVWHLRATVLASRWMRTLPQVVLLGAMLWHSPMVRGMSDEKMEARIEANRMLYAIDHGLLPPRLTHTEVLILAPGRGSNVKILRRWLQRIHTNRTTRWSVLASGLPIRNLVKSLDDTTLVLGRRARLDKGTQHRFGIDGRAIALEDLAASRRRVWLVYPDRDGVWRAKDLTRR